MSHEKIGFGSEKSTKMIDLMVLRDFKNWSLAYTLLKELGVFVSTTENDVSYPPFEPYIKDDKKLEDYDPIKKMNEEILSWNGLVLKEKYYFLMYEIDSEKNEHCYLTYVDCIDYERRQVCVNRVNLYSEPSTDTESFDIWFYYDKFWTLKESSSPGSRWFRKI